MLSMLFSFLLSRTLVPTLAKYMLKPHADMAPKGDVFSRFQQRFESGFEHFRTQYQHTLERALQHRRWFIVTFLCIVMLSFALVPFIGRNFFPDVDSGQIALHARAPVGMRVEETAARFADVQDVIREVIPSHELDAMVDNVGTYISSMNTIYANTGMIGSSDGDISITLASGHQPTAAHIKRLREVLPERFPDMTFSFLPADIVSQILNFGAPSPIDIQVRGRDLNANYDYANLLLKDIRKIDGMVDARIQQSRQAPAININIDRNQATYAGITQRDISNSLVVNLAGSAQVSSTFWLNPANGVQYPIVMQVPQHKIDSFAELNNIPISADAQSDYATLGGMANFDRSQTSAVFSEYNIEPMVQIFATTQGRDLGAVAADVERVLSTHEGDKPRGATVVMKGQVSTMQSAYTGLLTGLLGAICLVYFIIVINFQSWRDPFIIIMALPAAMAGIVWMLSVGC